MSTEVGARIGSAPGQESTPRGSASGAAQVWWVQYSAVIFDLPFHVFFMSVTCGRSSTSALKPGETEDGRALARERTFARFHMLPLSRQLFAYWERFEKFKALQTSETWLPTAGLEAVAMPGASWKPACFTRGAVFLCKSSTPLLSTCSRGCAKSNLTANRKSFDLQPMGSSGLLNCEGLVKSKCKCIVTKDLVPHTASLLFYLGVVVFLLVRLFMFSFCLVLLDFFKTAIAVDCDTLDCSAIFKRSILACAYGHPFRPKQIHTETAPRKSW